EPVADAAHHPEPNARRVERAGHRRVADHYGRPLSRKFISYTQCLYRTLLLVRKPVGGPAQPIWTQPPPPPRPRSLGREEIVTAAIGLADEAGPEAVTMKAVAARLGSYTAMALYRYVYSKDGLVDLMLDAAAAEIPRPGQPGPSWRADLRELAGQTR